MRRRGLQAAQRGRPPRVGLEPGLARVGVPPCRRTRAGEPRRAASARAALCASAPQTAGDAELPGAQTRGAACAMASVVVRMVPMYA